MSDSHKNHWIVLVIVALIGAIGVVVAGYLSGVNITFNNLQPTATQFETQNNNSSPTAQVQPQIIVEEVTVLAPTHTPYPTYTPQPAPSPIVIIATPTTPPPTPTVDVAIIDANKPWEVDGVAIRLSPEFNTAATELLIKWEITNIPHAGIK